MRETWGPRAVETAVRLEEAEFAELVREHQSMVFGIALRTLGDRAVAEELAQEVFLQLHRHLGQLESTGHLVHWLRRVTANRCVDELRRRRFRAVPLEDAHLVETDGEVPDPLARRVLLRLLGGLPPRQRLVVTLRYQEEMELGEIASVLGMPLNTVKSHLRRGIDALRRGMERAGKGAVDGSRA